MFSYNINNLIQNFNSLKSAFQLLVEAFIRFAYKYSTMLNNSSVNNKYLKSKKDYFFSKNAPVFVVFDLARHSPAFSDNFMDIKNSGIYTIGPLLTLLTIVLISFLYFTYIEKVLLVSLDKKINLSNLSKEQTLSYFFAYRLSVLKNLVIYSFKQLKVIFFFFSFFIFCFYTFLTYCPLTFNFYYASNYGFIFIFKNLLLIILFVVFIMFLFFKYGQYYSNVILSLNYEIPFLFAIAIIIFLFSLQVKHFLLLFLCFEIFSYCLYIIVSVRKQVSENNILNDKLSIESGLKYFIMGSLSSLVLMFGLCLFLLTGNSLTYNSMSFFLNNKVWDVDTAYNDMFPEFNISETYVAIGFFCLIMYFFFKLSLFPFHWWITEVFSSASFIVIFFISVPVKLISVFLLLHILNFSFYPYFFLFKYVVLFFVPYSLILGTIGMFYTSKLKTFLAYSTIYNMSYIFLLIGISNHIFGLFSLYVFLFGYLISMMLLLFVLIIFLCYTKKEMLYLTDFSFLKSINKLLNFYVIFLFFSFLGLPPLAGFWGKYLALIALLKSIVYLDTVNNPYLNLLYKDEDLFTLRDYDAISDYCFFGVDLTKVVSPYRGSTEIIDIFGIATIISVILIVITSLVCCFIYLRIIRIQLFENLNYLSNTILDVKKIAKLKISMHFDLFLCFLIISCFTVLIPIIYSFTLNYFDLYDKNFLDNLEDGIYFPYFFQRYDDFSGTGLITMVDRD